VHHDLVTREQFGDDWIDRCVRERRAADANARGGGGIAGGGRRSGTAGGGREREQPAPVASGSP
jgi:hypothetical protein